MPFTKNILDCLEQKKLLMTESLNLTKQLEVQSKHEEDEVSEIVDRRQILIDRMKKCDLLINKSLDEMEDLNNREQWVAVLADNEIQTDDEMLKKAMEYKSEINSLCSQIVDLNYSTNENYKSALNSAKQNLIDYRKNNKGSSLFL